MLTSRRPRGQTQITPTALPTSSGTPQGQDAERPKASSSSSLVHGQNKPGTRDVCPASLQLPHGGSRFLVGEKRAICEVVITWGVFSFPGRFWIMSAPWANTELSGKTKGRCSVGNSRGAVWASDLGHERPSRGGLLRPGKRGTGPVVPSLQASDF
jgi:hypothetical protein